MAEVVFLSGRQAPEFAHDSAGLLARVLQRVHIARFDLDRVIRSLGEEGGELPDGDDHLVVQAECAEELPLRFEHAHDLEWKSSHMNPRAERGLAAKQIGRGQGPEHANGASSLRFARREESPLRHGCPSGVEGLIGGADGHDRRGVPVPVLDRLWHGDHGGHGAGQGHLALETPELGPGDFAPAILADPFLVRGDEPVEPFQVEHVAAQGRDALAESAPEPLDGGAHQSDRDNADHDPERGEPGPHLVGPRGVPGDPQALDQFNPPVHGESRPRRWQ